MLFYVYERVRFSKLSLLRRSACFDPNCADYEKRVLGIWDTQCQDRIRLKLANGSLSTKGMLQIWNSIEKYAVLARCPSDAFLSHSPTYYPLKLNLVASNLPNPSLGATFRLR